MYAKGYRLFLVVVLSLTFGLAFLTRMSLLFLSPYFTIDIHISTQQVAYLASVLAITWALSGLVFGAISDRFGRKIILVPAVVGFSLFSCLSGLAHTFLQLLLIRAGMGVLLGPCVTIAPAIVEQSSHPQRRARDVGIMFAGAVIMGLSVAPVLTTQVAFHYGWRAAFFAVGIPGFLVAIPLALLVKEDRQAFIKERDQASIADYLIMLRSRNVRICCIGAAALASGTYLLNTFAPLYITQALHRPGTTAGYVLGAAGLASVLLGFATTPLANRMARKKVLLGLGVLTAIVPLAMVPARFYDRVWVIIILVLLTNGTQTLGVLVNILVPTENAPPKLAATVIGLTMLSGEIIGGTLVPAIAGVFATRYGLVMPMYLSAAAYLVLATCAIFLTERKPAASTPAIAEAVPLA